MIGCTPWVCDGIIKMREMSTRRVDGGVIGGQRQPRRATQTGSVSPVTAPVWREPAANVSSSVVKCRHFSRNLLILQRWK
ncbi:MAG: hypothetical protein HWD60_13810 [Defluviicoccus sp.]|nr:MAG: hypothetical protein HWD60_13810 [Defluviicoccus sp.]